MWLINTKTMKLEFFYNPSILKYAILSHTWGDEEVGFQDWQQIESDSENGAILKKKLGYSKIEMTCRMARERRLEYTWIDTCCIDKSSSSELSEAINSMFNWYKCSEICFVYLSDYTWPVPVDCSPEVTAVPPAESDLWSCRWFRRGWSLQELIAPQKVVFFDCNWDQFGDKSELVEMLSEITNIDTGVLTGHQRLHEVSVAQRMSWAACRETTRIEDCAYCLLGIFDINMHLMYGEGDKAFLRLQEKILKKCNDLSLFAWERNTLVTESERYGEIFASSPIYFAECSKMKSLAQTQRRRKEFALTNNGLKVDAVFERDGEDETCYLDLDTWEGTESSEGWVYVELIRKGDFYVRQSLRTEKSRLVWTSPYCEVRPICIQKTSQGFEDPLWLFGVQSSIEITCEMSLRNLMAKKGHCYGKGAGTCLPSFNAHFPNYIKMTVEHTLAGNWLVIFPFTFESSGAAKHINVAVACGQNNCPEMRKLDDLLSNYWIGLFGEPAEYFNLADNVLPTVASLSHDTDLEESEVLEGVEDILFSQFSNNLGQVLDSKLPKEFVIPDEDPSPNSSRDRIFLRIDVSDKFKISIHREKISSAPTGDSNRRKRIRRR